MKRDIENREDIQRLVQLFYARVRKHKELGSIFNETITDWDAHLEKITDFWEANLFYKTNFKGNPPQVHAQLDQQRNQEIEQAHFGYWLTLWNQTVDELFFGEKATEARNRARNMAHMLFMVIHRARTEKGFLDAL